MNIEEKKISLNVYFTTLPLVASTGLVICLEPVIHIAIAVEPLFST